MSRPPLSVDSEECGNRGLQGLRPAKASAGLKAGLMDAVPAATGSATTGNSPNPSAQASQNMCDPLLARGVAGPAPMDPLTVVSRRIAFKQADLSRALKGALSAGLSRGASKSIKTGRSS